jgi:hypothetical protein
MKKNAAKLSNLKNAREFGEAYADWCVNHDNYTDGPVEYEKTYPTIPEGDYIMMKNRGIETNDREYWEGFNSFFK